MTSTSRPVAVRHRRLLAAGTFAIGSDRAAAPRQPPRRPTAHRPHHHHDPARPDRARGEPRHAAAVDRDAGRRGVGLCTSTTPRIAAVDDAAVEITVHRSVSSRTEFDRAVSGEELPGVRARLTYPLSSLGVNKQGNFGVAFGLSGSGAERAVAVDEPGVYPVEVGVVDAGDERTTFVTWMVVVDPDSSEGSRTAARLVDLAARRPVPVQGADGTVGQVRARRDPDAAAGSIASRPCSHAPVASRSPSASVPRRWRAGSTQSRKRTPPSGAAPPACAAPRDAESIQLLPEPYVPIDGPTIEAEELGAHVPDEYVAGSNAIEAATGEIPDPRTAFEAPRRRRVGAPAHANARRPVRRSRHGTRTGGCNRALRRSRSHSRPAPTPCRPSRPTAASSSSSTPTVRPCCGPSECSPRSPRSRTRRHHKPAASCSRCRPTGSPTSRP